MDKNETFKVSIEETGGRESQANEGIIKQMKHELEEKTNRKLKQCKTKKKQEQILDNNKKHHRLKLVLSTLNQWS